MRPEDRRLIRDLLDDDRDDVVSLYMPVDPADPRNQRSSGEEWWRAKAGSLVKELQAQVAEARAGDLDVAIEQLEEFARSYVVDERSVAVFADPSGVLAVPLQVHVEPQAGFGRPLVFPFVKALLANRPYLVIQIAADQVRVVEFALGDAEAAMQPRLSESWDMPGPTRSGHRFRFEARREQYQQLYQQRIASRIDRLVDDHTIERLVLSGADREAHGVLAALSERSLDLVAGVVPAPLDEGPDDLAMRIRPVVREFEESNEDDVVDRILRRQAASGSGSVGIANTRAALEMRLVRRLVLDPEQLDSKLCEELLRSALRQGANITILFGPAKNRVKTFEGVVADLHFNPFD